MKISTFFLLLLFYLYSGNLSAEIFYVDIDKIINQTNVGKHINEEFKNSKKINDTKNLESKDLLKKREDRLIAQKNILEVNEFNNRLRLFRKDVNDFNQLNQKSNIDLQNKLMKNKANFLKLIEPILLDYVSENNITYLLQKKYIIVGHNDLNKTTDIIKIVDKKIDILNLMTQSLNKKEIIDLLPHREPMLLIDQLTNIKKLHSATAIVHVKKDSFFVQGHFPGQPVMPGVLIVEAFGQAAAALTASGIDKKEYENKLVFLMGVDKARFRNPVIPDCKLELNIEAIRSHGRVWKYKGEAFVEGKKMADAQWSATIVDRK